VGRTAFVIEWACPRDAGHRDLPIKKIDFVTVVCFRVEVSHVHGERRRDNYECPTPTRRQH
jgi:hypothetical protein